MLLFAFSFFDAQEVIFKKTNEFDVKHNNGLDFIFKDNNYQQIDDLCRKEFTQSRADPLFKKLVLIVIDALRHDFIPSIDHKKSVRSDGRKGVPKRMPFTEEIMKTNGN